MDAVKAWADLIRLAGERFRPARVRSAQTPIGPELALEAWA